MGEQILILTFVVIVIGGIGSIRGALVGALVVGVVDTFARALLPGLFRLFLEPATADGGGGRHRVDGDLSADGGGAVLPAARPVSSPWLSPVRRIRPPASGGCRRAGLALLAFLIALPWLPTPRASASIPTSPRRSWSFALAAVSLDLILGYGGLVSFGHAAFVGVGAYVVGILFFHDFDGSTLFRPAGHGRRSVVVWALRRWSRPVFRPGRSARFSLALDQRRLLHHDHARPSPRCFYYLVGGAAEIRRGRRIALWGRVAGAPSPHPQPPAGTPPQPVGAARSSTSMTTRPSTTSSWRSCWPSLWLRAAIVRSRSAGCFAAHQGQSAPDGGDGLSGVYR